MPDVPVFLSQQRHVNPDNNNRLTAVVSWGSLALSSLVTLATLGWLIWRSRYGIDFSDESFYLAWISNPWIYSYSVTQFGFIYHPLYLLVGGDVALLRQANILLTFLLAWALCWSLFRQSRPKGLGGSRQSEYAYVALAAILASSALTFFSFWLPTPGYNSLALQSLLIAATGLLLAEPQATCVSIVGWFLIGLAGWLAFMAKPTTAAALGLVSACYLLASGRFNLRLVVLSLAVALGLLMSFAWVVDGSLHGFIERLANGIEGGKRLNSGHTIAHSFRMDDFFLSAKEKSALLLGSLLLGVSTLALMSRISRQHVLALLLPVAASLVALGFITGAIAPEISPTQFQGLQLAVIPFGLIIATLLTVWETPSALLNRKVVALAACFAVLPYVYAFGTGNNYWSTASGAGIFWLLAGFSLVVLAKTKPAIIPSWHVWLPATACAQAIAVALLYIGMESPYRQPQPLRLNQQAIKLRPEGAPLMLSKSVGDYIELLHRLAEKEHFQPGTPVIDLTGHYPGALYSLQAKSIGQAWMVGGYKGSNDLATFALDRVPCSDIGEAWLLMEINGPDTISPAILRRYGADIASDYTLVGELNSPAGAYTKIYRQQLMKPLRSALDARQACEHARANRQ